MVEEFNAESIIIELKIRTLKINLFSAQDPF